MPDPHAIRVAQLFDACIDLPPADRRAFLEAECQDDVELREEIESLLAADERVETRESRRLALWLKDLATGMETPEPQYLGPYRLVRKLGEGGMSVVYLGVREDGELNRRVAIKLVRPDHFTPRMIRRFENERQILAGLNHPAIASLYDAGRTADGVPFFIMEYIEGEAIDAYCDHRQLAVPERLVLFRQICIAIHYAHQNLVVHRDIKPSNILVTPEATPKLLDFGIAKLLNADLVGRTQEPTQPWERILTPEYASPEQLAGTTITTASDIYSLGVLLFTLLAGSPPFNLRDSPPAEAEKIVLGHEAERASSRILRLSRQSDSGAETAVEDIARRRSTQPGQLARALRGDLDAILSKALRKEPQHRYTSAAQFAEDIRRTLEGKPIRARRGTFRYRAGRFLMRHRLKIAAAVTILILVMTATILLFAQSRRLTEHEHAARRERDKAQAITTFLVGLFGEANPRTGRSELITTRSLLDRGVERISEELREQEETQADLFATLGEIYLQQGIYEPARQALTRSLTLRQHRLAPEDERIARSMLSLAGLESETGNFARAESLGRDALRILERGPPDSREEATPERLRLAAVLYNREKFPEAERLLQQVLHSAEAETDVDIRSSALDLLGQIHWIQGRLAEAERILREALDLRRQQGGSKNGAVAASLNNLALVMRDRGHPEQADAMLEEAGTIWRTLFGDRHLTRAIVVHNRGSLALQQGDLDAAAKRFRESLDLIRTLLPAGHGQRVRPLLGLARLLYLDGQVEESARRIREVLDLCQKRRSPESLPCREATNLHARGLTPGTGSPALHRDLVVESRAESLTSAMLPSAAGWCVPDGGFDDTLTRYRCCSGRSIQGTTVCINVADWGTTWTSCGHVCGTRLVGGCVPPGGIDDTLEGTACCSGTAIAGSTRCLNPADYGTTWKSCVHTCA